MALVFYLLLLFLHHSRISSADPLYQICGGGTYTTNSTYNTNLNNLLDFFASLGFVSFIIRTQGSNPDIVYGLILCRGDVSSSDCNSCVQNAAQDVLSRCPTSKQATIWYDNCELRYSDVRFFSSYGPSNSVIMYNTKKVTDHVEDFVQMQGKLLDELTYQAAYNSPLMFATGTANNGSDPTVNGLVQCTRDLSMDDCSQCLKRIWEIYTNAGYQTNQGGRVLGVSCNFRYEAYGMYRYDPNVILNLTVLAPQSSSTPSSTPSSAGAKGIETSTNGLNKRRKITIAVSVSLVLGLLLLSCIIYFIWRKKKTTREENCNEDEDLELPLYDMDIIIAGTNNFSIENKLGEGGFGPVYKGKLPEGQEIAVKRLSKTSKQGVDEFKNEVLLIAKLQHRNLVRLLGCCTRGEERMLVYEYMPNKSLDAFLFDKVENINLSWRMRFNIIIGIARGLLYLHQDSRFRIIHRDLKASNVLLDEEMNPKISDFGLARIFGAEEATAWTGRVVGTYGYMSPEYAMDGIFSVKSDVFSFGVLVLEIVSGKRTKAVYFSEPEDNLLRKAWRLWSEGKGLELIDPAIDSDFSVDEIIRCIKVGLLCVQENPKARPKMSLVVHMLSEGASIFEPQQPGFLSFPSSSSANQDLPSINTITVSLDVGR